MHTGASVPSLYEASRALNVWGLTSYAKSASVDKNRLLQLGHCMGSLVYINESNKCLNGIRVSKSVFTTFICEHHIVPSRQNPQCMDMLVVT